MSAPDRITTKSQSPDSPSVDQSDSTSSSSAQVVIGGKTTTLLVVLVAVLLALDIGAQVARFMKEAEVKAVSHDAETEDRLKQYNMDFFRTHEFAALEVKVGVIEKMLPVKCQK